MSGITSPKSRDYTKKPCGHPARIPGAASQPVRGQGGSFGTMFVGMSIVAAGLIGFYFAQFKVQGKRNPAEVKDLTQVPTWQLRHAQQQPGAVPELPKGDNENYTLHTPTFDPQPAKTLPLPGRDIESRPIASLLSAVHGKGSDDTQNDPRHVAQPATTQRQTGERMVTKRTDYVDSYQPKN